jgi:preprotein translocase subunit SecD
MLKTRLAAAALILLSVAVGYFVYTTEPKVGETAGRFAFHLGLDLRPGSHLVYKADTAQVAEGTNVTEALETLRDVIERRVNLFGVAEPLVQIDRGGVFGQGDYRLIVELPGVTDVSQAVKMIGETPTLEFRLVKAGQEAFIQNADGSPNLDAFEPAALTGKNLKRAAVEFTQGGIGSSGLGGQPTVRVDFDAEGAAQFENLTGSNIGRYMSIFLDGEIVSTPVIRERIAGGTAIISGSFTAEEAKALAKNLNFGALPVPIELESTQSIGATLGERALNAGVFAGLVGLAIVALFMLLWYRLPGLVAVVALGTYVALMLAFFKLIPVTLTAAGIAGFILSIGLAVDANVLIFERLKEELRSGKSPEEAIREGFARAWTSIWDSNVAHIIAGIILFWFGTSLVQGFALVFVMGVLVSMLSAITVSRTFLLALGMKGRGGFSRFLMGTGLSK